MHAQCICGEVKKVFFLYLYCTNFNKNVVSHHMHSKYTAYYGRLGRIPYIYINFKPFSSYCAHKLMHRHTHTYISNTHTINTEKTDVQTKNVGLYDFNSNSNDTVPYFLS